MARTGRKVTTASLEAKIEKQKELLAKSKDQIRSGQGRNAASGQTPGQHAG